MTKYLLTVTAILTFFLSARSQDSVQHRIIFIGDAGEINFKQETVIPAAANHIIPGKTTVMYLGDNIYPVGMGLKGSAEEEDSKKILQSQFIPMRAKGAPVYFIPGNHDWDKMGRDGLAKIKAQWSYLEEQKDPLLHLVPANGCPGPYEINVSDSMTIIAFDSEWWVFPFKKENDADCECNTEKEVLDKMEALLYKNRFKVILLASHHPFQSYGIHGGNFTLKDHLFPFLNLNKNLFIPLPVIGSLYPILRTSIFNSPEDLKHPVYKNMVKQIDHVFDKFPNLVHVAGHEHGLQFIKDGQVQIVSGAGSKKSNTKRGKNSLFADAMQGFVTVDLLAGNATKITFYTYDNDSVKNVFTYTQPYKNIQALIDSMRLPTLSVDSVSAQANALYDNHGKFHRFLFGENYRKEWAAPTNVPVIRISTFKGGLTPLERGGGFQSLSLRLVDKTGKEWVLRSINKNPDPILPEELRQTFARDFLDDATSAQHPYSALIVPPIADAVNVPHANPVIGMVAADTALGIFNRLFANTLCLLEEREPLGKSDNTPKMMKALVKDNENTFKEKEFLRARMLDVLLGDWDRHADQWRWKNESDKDKTYLAIPRDRDQVLHLTQGILPWIASRPAILPTLQGFGSRINDVRYSLIKSAFLNDRPEFQIEYDQWMKQVNAFKDHLTDSSIREGISRLPKAVYEIRHEELFNQLKERRDNLPAAMEWYYRFINKIVDIQTSDKNEMVEITGNPDQSLTVLIKRITKDGIIKDKLIEKKYDPSITKEIRIYTNDGNDSVVINNTSSPIRIRLIGGDGKKVYNVQSSNKNIRLYFNQPNISYYGDVDKISKHFSTDTLSTSFVPVNLYNLTIPLVTAGYNLDDGFILGAGVRLVKQEGFRKTPYTSSQQLMVSAAFATGAFKIKYSGDWINVIGNTDITLDAKMLAPDNTQNFFGVGNNTVFNKTGDFKRYYRARFSVFQLDPALRFHLKKNTTVSIGPSIQYYHVDPDDNIGRMITNTSLIHSYDSATINTDKIFSGFILNYATDNRNNTVIPTAGGYLKMKVQGYAGLNNYSRSFLQATPEMAVYASLDRQSNVVIANRIGGGITFGHAAFYQSLFMGGHDNLLGYSQYRFAGRYMVYNNFELRIKLAQVSSYLLPGQLGLIGFYDAGKVWSDGYNSSTIHQGIGGGIYYAPAQITVIQFVLGHSSEGTYPYVSLGFRF